MYKWLYLSISGFICLTSIILGAFGAHLLKTFLSIEALEIFKLAVQYQFNHGIGLAIVAFIFDSMPNKKGLHFISGFFIAGVFLFSGSLYFLALGSPRWVGIITPFGGLCFILGWVTFFLTFLQQWRETKK